MTSDETITTELRQLQNAAEGQRVAGTVMGEPTDVGGGEIELTVETPISEFTERFEKPKPPLETHAFTRVADEYGHGLVDVSALDGCTVQCQYDPDDDGWSVVVPEPSRQQRMQTWVHNTTLDIKLVGVLACIGGIVAFPLTILSLTIYIASNEPRHDVFDIFISSLLVFIPTFMLWLGVVLHVVGYLL